MVLLFYIFFFFTLFIFFFFFYVCFFVFFFFFFFFFSSRRRHTRCLSDWSSDVCSSDLARGDRARGGRTASGGPVRRARGIARSVTVLQPHRRLSYAGGRARKASRPRFQAASRSASGGKRPLSSSIRSEERRGGNEGRYR